MKVVYGKGINDMLGWGSKCEYNERVYRLWKDMIQRCYSEHSLERFPTYKGCYVCDRWLLLSNFVEDIKLIENYDLWLSGLSEKRNPYELDKDIKSDGKNKCYCLEQCQFVHHVENTRQSCKNKSKTGQACKNKSRLYKTGLIERWKNGVLIDIKHRYQFEKLGFDGSNISKCCIWYAVGEDYNEWFKTHKYNPIKSVGLNGEKFIFKYHES